MSAAETDLIVWLIEEHLTMSNFAHSRDITDPETVRKFADIVQSPERLKLLLLLTCADIRAVGPGVWNGWKGQLLRTLYYETEPLVAGGHTAMRRNERIIEAQNALRAALPGWPKEDIDRFISRHYQNYWLRTETKSQVEHAELLRQAEKAQTKIATRVKTDAFTAITELTVFAPNHARSAVAVCWRMRCRRIEYRWRTHHDHARWLRARHVPAQSRIHGRRRRVAPRQAHR